MLEVKNIRVRSLDSDYLDIYWDIEPTFEDVSDYTFTVEKAYTQFGPFQELVTGIRDKFHIRDNTVRGKHNMYTNTYYRVIAINTVTSESRTYPETDAGVNLRAPPDLVALELARLHRLKLKEFAGRKVWVFPRKRFGQRCSCYDPVTNRKMRAQCATCYDTGWVGGFDAPLEIYAQIKPPIERTNRSTLGEQGIENTSGLFPNYPELQEGWIVVEAENIRWRVGAQINKVQKSRALVKQLAPLHRVPSSDAEYMLPLNVADLSSIEVQPERNLTNPQTLEGGSNSTTLDLAPLRTLGSDVTLGATTTATDEDVYKPSGQTVDGVAAPMWVFELAKNTAYRIRATVVANQEGDANRASYVRSWLVYRAAGDAVLEGSVTSPETDIESNAAWAVTADVTQTSTRLLVTGAAGAIVKWKGRVEITAI